MKKLNDLINIYPKAFEGDWYGFECKDGWYDIIEPVIKAIHEHNSSITNPQEREIYPEQVKEKYGTLRFYTNYVTAEIDRLVNEAENKSVTTCERCGKKGELICARWLYTACPEHMKEGDRTYAKFMEEREYNLTLKLETSK